MQWSAGSIFFATLLDITGTSVPASIDGKSFSNVLFGKSKSFRDKIYSTHSGDVNMNVYPMHRFVLRNIITSLAYIRNICIPIIPIC